MSKLPKRWKSGQRMCWWAIVSREPDPMYPLPWSMGSTRSQAWKYWREWLGESGDATRFKAVRAFIVEAE